MEFPTTRAKLIAANWRCLNSTLCAGCKAAIEWWMTDTKAKIPLEMITAQSLRTHWESCPNAAEFREKRKARRDAVKQGELFP